MARFLSTQMAFVCLTFLGYTHHCVLLPGAPGLEYWLNDRGGFRLNNQTRKCSAGKMGLELGALGSCFCSAPTPPPMGPGFFI